MGFPGGSVVKNLPANAGDARHSGSISGSGRGLGGGNGNSPQYSCLENPMDWTEEPGGLYSIGSQRDMTEHSCKHTHTYTHTQLHTLQINKTFIDKTLRRYLKILFFILSYILSRS